jgi:hypothetical protein
MDTFAMGRRRNGAVQKWTALAIYKSVVKNVVSYAISSVFI